MNTSLLSAAPTGYNSVNAIVRENPMDVITVRMPANGYVLLNSRDRYLTSQPNQTEPILQSWNNFTLQRAQAMIPSYAKRLQVSEIRFPWYIPNITARNDTISIIVNAGVPGVLTIPVAVFPGFYTPVSFLTAFNQAIQAQYVANGLLATQAPELAWDAQLQSFYFEDVSGTTLPFGIAAPGSAGGFSAGNMSQTVGYFNNPSLALTMGVPYGYLSTDSSAVKYLNSPGISTYLGATMFLYTEYVDIASDQLMRFTDARDGGSNNLTSTSLLTRLYLADEISVSTADPIGSSPFLIHRQFKNPKTIKWEPRSFLNYLDIKIYDQYGELVALNGVSGLPTPTAYPDFQITLLASED
jgi:hypothetical protein